MFSRIKQMYLSGLKWSTEFILQRVYNAVIIIEILYYLCSQNNTKNLHIIVMVVHLLSIYVVGYKKGCWEGSCFQGSNKEKMYQIIYFALNGCLILTDLIFSKSLILLLLLIIPIMVSLSSAVIINIIIPKCIEKIMNKIINIKYSKLEYMYILMSLMLNIIFFALALYFINITFKFKIIIFMLYVILIPLVNYWEDECMNFYAFFAYEKI